MAVKIFRTPAKALLSQIDDLPFGPQLDHIVGLCLNALVKSRRLASGDSIGVAIPLVVPYSVSDCVEVGSVRFYDEKKHSFECFCLCKEITDVFPKGFWSEKRVELESRHLGHIFYHLDDRTRLEAVRAAAPEVRGLIEGAALKRKLQPARKAGLSL